MATAISQYLIVPQSQNPWIDGRLNYSVSRNGNNVTVNLQPGIINSDDRRPGGSAAGAYRYDRYACCIYFKYGSGSWNKVVDNFTIKPKNTGFLGKDWYPKSSPTSINVTIDYPGNDNISVKMEIADTGYGDSWGSFQFGSPWTSPTGSISVPPNNSKVWRKSGTSSWAKDRYIWKTTDGGAHWNKVFLYKTTNTGANWTKINLS